MYNLYVLYILFPEKHLYAHILEQEIFIFKTRALIHNKLIFYNHDGSVKEKFYTESMPLKIAYYSPSICKKI